MSAEKEVSFGRDEMIISKTDLQGRLTYANRTFMRVANFSEIQLLGQNHNIIRHPSMPRGVFHGLWKTLKSGQEFFGFVKNTTADGNYYWVFANITPDVINGKTVGYYSVRRTPPKESIEVIKKIYQQMSEKERHADRKQAPELSWNWMVNTVEREQGMSYEQYVLDLYKRYR
ncbi:PAS domain-containing protein [Vibrio fluvialis]|uniref:PAS domain-containing protein n=1 Tax=Vibrio fluvialis TaxID=676 RepID=UPI001EEB2343|nr:PAS domain-containing protein [Vibrio fluvialis]